MKHALRAPGAVFTLIIKVNTVSTRKLEIAGELSTLAGEMLSSERGIIVRTFSKMLPRSTCITPTSLRL